MEVPQVTWEDIGGLEDVKRELQELVQVRFLTRFCLVSLKIIITKSRTSSDSCLGCDQAPREAFIGNPVSFFFFGQKKHIERDPLLQ